MIGFRTSRIVAYLDSASKYYEISIEFYEKAYEGYFHDHGKSYNNWGKVLRDRLNHVEAIYLFEKALEIWEKDTTTNNQALPSIYNNLGGAHFELREYETAIRNYEIGIALIEKIPGFDISLWATKYNLYKGLGGAFIKSGEFAKGIAIQKKILGIAVEGPKGINGDLSHLNTSQWTRYISAVNDIGTSFQAQKLYDSARVYSLKALTLCQEQGIDNNLLLYSIYNTLGTSYRGLGEYGLALECFKNSEIAGRKHYGEIHHNIATVYNNLGYTMASWN